MKSTDREFMQEEFEEKKKRTAEIAREIGEPHFRVSKWRRRFGLSVCDHDRCSNCEDCPECGGCECEECEECGEVFKNLAAHESVHEE